MGTGVSRSMGSTPASSASQAGSLGAPVQEHSDANRTAGASRSTAATALAGLV